MRSKFRRGDGNSMPTVQVDLRALVPIPRAYDMNMADERAVEEEY